MVPLPGFAWMGEHTLRLTRGAAHHLHHRPLHPLYRRVHRTPQRTRHPSPRRRPLHPQIPPRSAIQLRSARIVTQRSRHRLHPSQSARRPPSQPQGLHQHRLAQHLIPRIRRLHGHSAIRRRPRHPDRNCQPHSHRHHVRRSRPMALSPLPHLRRPHPQRLASPRYPHRRPRRRTQTHSVPCPGKRPAHLPRSKRTAVALRQTLIRILAGEHVRVSRRLTC